MAKKTSKTSATDAAEKDIAAAPKKKTETQGSVTKGKPKTESAPVSKSDHTAAEAPAKKSKAAPAKAAEAPVPAKASAKKTDAKAPVEVAPPPVEAPKAKASSAKEKVEPAEEPVSKAAAPAKKSAKTTAASKTKAAPTLPPVPLPKVKKPLEPSEVVIKQAYNPKKLPPFYKKQQQRLIELRSALLDSLDEVAKETLRARPEGSDASVGGMHMGDAGSDAYDRDFALSMLSKEQDALYEINEALKRIDNGVYGVCELSAEKINEERLEALPYTRYTRDMQEQIERDQMGGRFRRPVVRSVFGLDDETDDDDDDEEEGTTSNNNNDSSLDFGKE